MVESQSDATLLERFARGREEAAFAELVQRHGPRVEQICRRILRNEQDAEDAFQATFLVLARKAAGIAWRDSASPWIDSVARRLALHARSGAARRRGRERSVAALTGGTGIGGSSGLLPERYHPTIDTRPEIERRDLRRVLDDELARLPEKYRAPVVLCDLEGHTRDEAARRLGWPSGSMSRRLDRARSLLRQRLTGRGIALAVVVAGSLAAAALGLVGDRSRPGSAVRQVMASFRSESDGGRGYGAVLADAAGGASDRPAFARVAPAAREAAGAAMRLRGLVKGPLAAIWDGHAMDMEHSAAELERACRDADAAAVVAAARRLDASCTNCHAVFRPREQAGTVQRASLSRRAGAGRRVDPRRGPPAGSNDWVKASVKTGQPVCWVMAVDRWPMVARPGWG